MCSSTIAKHLEGELGRRSAGRIGAVHILLINMRVWDQDVRQCAASRRQNQRCLHADLLAVNSVQPRCRCAIVLRRSLELVQNPTSLPINRPKLRIPTLHEGAPSGLADTRIAAGANTRANSRALTIKMRVFMTGSLEYNQHQIDSAINHFVVVPSLQPNQFDNLIGSRGKALCQAQTYLALGLGAAKLALVAIVAAECGGRVGSGSASSGPNNSRKSSTNEDKDHDGGAHQSYKEQSDDHINEHHA